MDNEKGLTLIEILAALSISSFVLVVMFSLFSSVNQQWSKSVESHNDYANANLALDVMARELSSPNHVYFYSSSDRKELRFGDFNQKEKYKALVYDENLKTLTLSKINDPSLTTPIFSDSVTLSNNLTKLDVYLVDESGETLGSALSYSNPTPIDQMFQIVVSHSYSKVKVDGSLEYDEREAKLSILPLKERK